MASQSHTVRIVPMTLAASKCAYIRDGQLESAKIWTVCRDKLQTAMKDRTKWPTRDSLQKATKGRFALHSQSAQMVCHAFLANVDTARQLRAAGDKQMRYPHRDKVFYPLLWPAQAMDIKGNRIILPMGRGRGSLTLPRPDWLTQPVACKLVWNRTGYELHVSLPVLQAAPVIDGAHATVDLGQIHQYAVTTNTGKGLIVSGRGIRSEKQRITKVHREIAVLQSKCVKGSRRWNKLQHARNTQAVLSERRIRDKRHKGSRAVINFCGKHKVSDIFVGNPHGVRNKPCGRHHNQRMSQWEYGKDYDYLEYKAQHVGMTCFNGSERGTSSHCPSCNHRHKPRGRTWNCPKCSFEGHRDLVGSINMHPLAFGERPTFPAANAVTYLRAGTSFQHALQRSNRPDTGHEVRNDVALLFQHTDSTNCSILPEKEDADQGFVRSTATPVCIMNRSPSL